MRKDYEKLFSYFKHAEPPDGLFDRVIFAIQKEQELRQTRKALISFLFFLIVSAVAMPFSAIMLVMQIQNSGILYFISAIAIDLGSALALWQDFSLAILESMPIESIASFLLSIAIAAFTIRLFLRRKNLLFRYFYSINFS